MLDWENERFVKIYTRDTADWLALSWDAQGLFLQLCRKVDKLGFLDLGRHGKRAVAISINQVALWDARLAPALEELLADGCVVVDGNRLLIRNFVEAQEARKSNAQRQRDFKELRRAKTNGSADGGNETFLAGNEEKRAVTAGNPPEQNRTEQKEKKGRRSPKPPAAGSLPGVPSSPVAAEPAPATQPLPPGHMPRRAGEALRVLHETSGGRFPAVEKRDVQKGQAIAIVQQIGRYPTIAEWERLGRWLAAGGLGGRTDLTVGWAASAGLCDAMVSARSWDGRAPLAPPRTLGPLAPPRPSIDQPVFVSDRRDEISAVAALKSAIRRAANE